MLSEGLCRTEITNEKLKINFTVYGNPVAQGRPKSTIINNRIIVYDPAKSKNFKHLVKTIAQDYALDSLITSAISLTVKAYISIPKSFSKKKRELALAGQLLPTTRPDLKNLIAGVEDALKGILYKDDSQVVNFGGSGKWYGDPPRVEILLEEARK